MSLSQNIDKLIKVRGMTRKEFAYKLIDLKPTLNRIGEVPSLSAIYTYINGKASIKAELIPYIAEVLGVTEQELYNDTKKTRLKYLKHIFQNPTQEEMDFIKTILVQETNIKQHYTQEVKEVIDLLEYAPLPFLDKIKDKLQNMKKEIDRF